MKELIYNQKTIPKAKWRYGIRSSAAAGCGWIATYNALILMGYEAFPKPLIRYFVKQIPLVNGVFGTVAWGPALYFKKRGFKITCSLRRKRFDEIIKNNDVCVLYYRWISKWKFGGHFVTVKYQDGRILGYNTYTNSVGPDEYGDSLEAFLKKKKYFGALLVGIKNKQS